MTARKLTLCILGAMLLLGLLFTGAASQDAATASTPAALVEEILGTPNEMPIEQKEACSALAVGKYATVNGGTLNCYTSDGRCDFRLYVMPAEKHAAGEMYQINYTGIEGGFVHDAVGEIPQVAETYQWFKAEVPFANEHQVFISENTCGSWPDLATMEYEEALIDWHTLAALALQRAKTASEAVNIMGELVETYGLRGDAESYMISDPNEVWMIEIVGNSDIWVAQRIPSNAVAFHANRLRIQEVDLNDSSNFRGSDKLISWAIEKGRYNPETDGAFSFEKAYSTGRESIGSARREWRAWSLLCPSVEWDPAAVTYPVYVIPEEKVSAQWVMDVLWRDVMEGTEYSLTEGIAAGPFGSPLRQGISGVGTERAISTHTNTYTTVCEARGWLPDALGGLIWYSNDTPRSSCFVPLYVGIKDVPESWHSGSYLEYSEDSAWWAFQILDTLSALRYRDMNADVRAVFDVIEAEQLAFQKDFEDVALYIYRSQGEAAMIQYLDNYSNQQCRYAEETARELFDFLLGKYVDGRPNATVDEEWQALLNQDDPSTYTTFSDPY